PQSLDEEDEFEDEPRDGAAQSLDEEDEFEEDPGDDAAQSLDDEEEFEEDAPSPNDDEEKRGEAAGLDDEEDEFDETDADVEDADAPLGESGVASLLTSLGQDGRFTLGYEIACHTDDVDRVNVNRTSLRYRWEHLFASRYFVLFDGKAAYNAVYDYLDYPDGARDQYRFFTRVNDFYLQAGAGAFSFKVGQQIVVWGEADGSVVTDVISPRDFTESVFIPIEDSRLGQIILKADLHAASGQWTLLLGPDPRVNIYPEPGHDYAGPSPSERPGIEVKQKDKPSFSLHDAEVGARWKKTFGKSDVSLMAASVLDNNPVYRFEGVNPGGELSLRPIYPRYTMLGAAANRARGNFLYKAELAYKIDRTFNHTDFAKGDGLVEKDVVDAALGVEYDANGAWLATLEISNQMILNHGEKIAGARRNETAAYFSWSKDFLNQTLHPEYTFFHQFQDRDSMHRLEIKYDINDYWTCKFGLTLFDIKKKSSPLSVFKNSHRLAARVEVSF
ncbi:MAG: hypothetical protein GY859_05810, partial [Desulfobacterales bacterium]|nr:hypothetical protein [Desulfobacterales bacterium]